MSFSLDVSEFAKLTERRVQETVNLVTIDMFSRIVAKTPVDTGRLRGNWIPKKQSPDRGQYPYFDKSGQQAMVEIMAEFRNSTADSHFLTNNLPYAAVVEYGLYPYGAETQKTINGYSKQAPQGMVRTVVGKFETAMKNAVAKAKRIK